eukprot:1137740-Pelagomonas_calceolata.AAC.1
MGLCCNPALLLFLPPQFLALESTEAVPRHVAQLAHAHKGVTLLFMDIVGFTSMCKFHANNQVCAKQCEQACCLIISAILYGQQCLLMTSTTL